MKSFLRLAIILSLFAISTDISAQPLTPNNQQIKLKSEGTGVLLSLVCTAAPLGIGAAASRYPATGSLALFGLLAGPSAGYFYAGNPGRAFKGIGIRLGATGLMVGGVAVAMNGNLFESDPHASVLGGTMIISGAGILLVDAIVDIASVQYAVKDHNLKMQSRSLSILPIYHPRSRYVGLQLGLMF